MKRFAVLLLLVSLPAWAGGDDPVPEGIRVLLPAVEPVAKVSAPVEGPVQTSLTVPIDLMAGAGPAMPAEERARRAQLTAAMHAELADLHHRTLANVMEESSRLDKAATVEASTEIERGIAQLKQDEQLESLRIQARYAREAGNEELAVEIDAAIAFLRNPQIDTTTVDRTPRPRIQSQR